LLAPIGELLTPESTRVVGKTLGGRCVRCVRPIHADIGGAHLFALIGMTTDVGGRLKTLRLNMLGRLVM
jgi:hypothetical protein